MDCHHNPPTETCLEDLISTQDPTQTSQIPLTPHHPEQNYIKGHSVTPSQAARHTAITNPPMMAPPPHTVNRDTPPQPVPDLYPTRPACSAATFHRQPETAVKDATQRHFHPLSQLPPQNVVNNPATTRRQPRHSLATCPAKYQTQTPTAPKLRTALTKTTGKVEAQRYRKNPNRKLIRLHPKTSTACHALMPAS